MYPRIMLQISGKTFDLAQCGVTAISTTAKKKKKKVAIGRNIGIGRRNFLNWAGFQADVEYL
jgi:hypothetical protein